MRSFVVGLVLGCFFLQTRSMLPDQPAWATVVLSLLMALSALGLDAGRTAGRASDKSRHTWTTFALASSAWMISGALLGVGYAQYRAETRLADALSREWEGRDIELVGTVTSLPTLTERGTRFMFEVDASSVKEARVPRNISLTWYVEQPRNNEPPKLPPILTPGERWKLSVRLRRPHGTANPHGFDFEAWALERNIRATGYVRVKGINQKQLGAADGMLVRVDRARLAIRDRMQAALQGQPYAGVLIALAIGEQNAIPAAQWKTFWRTGTGHLMSISGLHITMVAALLYWLAFRIWARLPHLTARIPAQRVAAMVGAVTALAYSLIAGFSVPTQRTFLMLLVVAIALTTGRAIAASRILAFALLGVVLLDPWCVLAPGFWLSFGAVAMIFYVTAQRTGQLSVVRAALLTQLAVTLGLLPLTLALFQEVSLISPIANAIAIPVISWVVVPITLVGALLPAGLSDVALQLAHWVMSLTYDCLAWLAAMPNAVWQSHAPAMWTVALAMIGVVAVMMPRGLPLRWLGGLAMLPMFVVLPPSPKPGELWLTLLDVGQGLATVVRTATHTLVYDTGPKWNPDADSGNRIVVPYLRGEGVRTLD
ncbi:MAG: DNA internalization-related competence protein ComEC/Rec2, partial [Burkholderiales bacterium]